MERTSEPALVAPRRRSDRPPGWIAVRALRALGLLLFVAGFVYSVGLVSAFGGDTYGPQYDLSFRSFLDVLAEVVPILLSGTVLFAFAAVIELLQRIEQRIGSPGPP